MSSNDGDKADDTKGGKDGGGDPAVKDSNDKYDEDVNKEDVM